jgi:hypothetical protein
MARAEKVTPTVSKSDFTFTEEEALRKSTFQEKGLN